MFRHMCQLFLFVSGIAHAALPAFPGAQGFGADSLGGRGGVVMHVTTLNDSGPGSLRACVEASGPRFCVFDVGGSISLLSPLSIWDPYITIAGQTAPGGGILLRSDAAPHTGNNTANVFNIYTSNVIIQYLRIRGGGLDSNLSDLNIAFWRGAAHVMIDHVSNSWSSYDLLSAWTNSGSIQNVTLSNDLFAEADTFGHSTAAITGGNTSALSSSVQGLTIHHSMFHSSDHRNPLFKSADLQLVNNVMYNNFWYNVQHIGGGYSDIVGNVFKKGPGSSGAGHEVQAGSSLNCDAVDGNPHVYLAGNIGWDNSNPSGNQTAMLAQVVNSRYCSGENGGETGPAPASWMTGAAHESPRYPVSVDSASTAESVVLASVGASRRLACDGSWVADRDSVDTRLINEYENGTGRTSPITLASQFDWPTIASGTKCLDSDGDGMPDVWEIAHGLNPRVDDHNKIMPSGFTAIEVFLNGR